MRGPHASLPKHWQEASLESRAFFRTMAEKPTLSITNVSEKDAGEYRCRIDYTRSTTKNVRVILTVVGKYSSNSSHISSTEEKLKKFLITLAY